MQRHEKLLKVYGGTRVNWAISELMARRGLAALSDDAVVSRNYRRERRTNEQNRAGSSRAA
jgi:hypothetical protein